MCPLWSSPIDWGELSGCYQLFIFGIFEHKWGTRKHIDDLKKYSWCIPVQKEIKPIIWGAAITPEPWNRQQCWFIFEDPNVRVARLLKSLATMTHIRCITRVKGVLTWWYQIYGECTWVSDRVVLSQSTLSVHIRRKICSNRWPMALHSNVIVLGDKYLLYDCPKCEPSIPCSFVKVRHLTLMNIKNKI